MVDANTSGREPITIVEIDQDLCSLTYGTAPCTASIGTTGSVKCYNTFPSCQDTANYTNSSLTLRFCKKSSNFPAPDTANLYLPIVENVTTNPTEVNINGGNPNLGPLGKRASVTVTMQDIPYNDAFVDKYISTRGFDPLTRSTFWVKFLARNKYYAGRALRVRDGYIGETPSTMRTRNYIIEKIVGPDANGRVTITAKDILKRADDKRSTAPVASTYTLQTTVLSSDDSTLQVTLSSGGLTYLNSGYPNNTYIKIGDEIIHWGINLGDPADTIRMTTRGISGTTAADHAIGDTVQLCLDYSDTRVDDVIYDLLTTYGDIVTSYITQADWIAEADTWLTDFNLNTIITEPIGVSQLVGELCQQCLCFIWWDEINQKIRFKAVRPADKTSITEITQDANIIENSVTVTRDPNQRLSQIWIYYKQVNPTLKLDETRNYDTIYVNENVTAESANEYNEARIKVIYSRWFSSANDGQVITLGSRSLVSYTDDPIYVMFSLDAKDRSLDVGDVINFTHRSFVDTEGAVTAKLLQIISRNEIESGHKIQYKAQFFGFIGNFANIMPNSANDYTSATDNEKLTGGYISLDTGKMSDGSDGYKIA